MKEKHFFFCYTSTTNKILMAPDYILGVLNHLNQKVSPFTVAVSSPTFLKQLSEVPNDAVSRPCYSEVIYCPLLLIRILQP